MRHWREMGEGLVKRNIEMPMEYEILLRLKSPETIKLYETIIKIL